MNKEISDAWSSTILGRELDVEKFVHILLSALPRAGVISGRLFGENEVEVTLGASKLTLKADAAKAKMRMICARLAVVFDVASRNPGALYGGHFAARVRSGEVPIDAELDFRNVADDPWFCVKSTT
jgi:hypothetical protein